MLRCAPSDIGIVKPYRRYRFVAGGQFRVGYIYENRRDVGSGDLRHHVLRSRHRKDDSVERLARFVGQFAFFEEALRAYRVQLPVVCVGYTFEYSGEIIASRLVFQGVDRQHF